MAGCGFWRDIFTVQAPTAAADAVGQATITWSTVGYVRGMIKPSQREVIDDMGVAVRTDLEIETAYYPSLTARCRLLLSGREFNVSSVVDPDAGRRKRLRVVATEVIL
jgi:head-tail adaptor